MIRGIFIVVVCVVLCVVLFVDIVLFFLIVVFDVGFLVYSVYNLVKGLKINVIEKLWFFWFVLRVLRI